MSADGTIKGNRVLVTGATGIVGSWLVKELLERNAEVVALVLDADPQSELIRSGDIERVAVVNGNLEDLETVERAINEHEVDMIFHLGAQTIVGAAHRSPLRTWETNIRGTYNVLEACRRHIEHVRGVVVASSDKAYGQAERLPYTEQTELAGRHPYEVSKVCADLIARSYHHTYGLPVAVARCGNVFGGGDLNWSRIVPGTIRSLLRGERPVLRSDGTYVRDYLYVKDAAASYISLAAHLATDGVAGEAFNFSSERPITVAEMVEEIRRLIGCEEIEFDIRGNAVGEIHDQALSAAKARDRLGWGTRYDLETGLRETIDWYRDFLS
jgi:CDP-glucose 4,6-dehydratase